MPSRRFKNLQAAREKRKHSSTVDKVPEDSTMASAPEQNLNCESVDLVDGMSPMERKTLARGTPIKVFIGNKCISQVHRDLFVAASSKAGNLINSKDEVRLPDSCDEGSAGFILNWAKLAPVKNKVFTLRIQRNLGHAVRVYHVAQELGMVRYVENTMGFQYKAMISRYPSKDDLHVIETHAADTEDRFVKMVAARIAYLMRHYETPDGFKDMADYMAMVATFALIDQAVHITNAPWEQRQVAIQQANARRAEKKRQNKARKAPRNSRDNSRSHETQDQKRWTEREINELRAHLLTKVNKKLVWLTAEERDHALWFKYNRKDPAFAMVV